MKKKQKNKIGRPTGTWNKRRFSDTKIGRMIYLYDPLIFHIICPKDKVGEAPEPWLIEKVCYFSNASIFKTTYFKDNLEDYKKNGLHVDRKLPIDESFIESINQKRFRKALNYVRKNKEKIIKEENYCQEIIRELATKIES